MSEARNRLLIAFGFGFAWAVVACICVSAMAMHARESGRPLERATGGER